MNTRYEKRKYAEGYTCVIGCDEVGRGSLAGPVVAAAVMLPQVESGKLKVIKSCGIRDSKLLLPNKREALSEVIMQNCVAWGIGEVPPEVIDEINIHNATLLAMRKAVESLFFRHCERVYPSEAISSNNQIASSPDKALVPRNDELFLAIDGKFCIPEFNMKQEAVVGGDNKILSIAAASIVAKVYRDELMRKLDPDYPLYNFSQHKGYGTLHHRRAILKNGLSPIHRKSFCSRLV